MKKNFLYAVVAALLLLNGCSSSISTTSVESNELPTALEQEKNHLDTQYDKSVKHEDSQFSSSVPSTTTTPADEQNQPSEQTQPDDYDYVLIFPSDSYPETALHIISAIENGHSDVCTIDREGADENRKQSLQGIDTKEGYDRDEWPMAMCDEGGLGASVAYIDSSDNRGAGSWVGHQLSAYENGERVLFIVEKPKQLFGEKSNENSSQPKANIDEVIVFKNCTEARDAGVTPLFEGDPGYSKKLDRDGDGIACEA